MMKNSILNPLSLLWTDKVGKISAILTLTAFCSLPLLAQEVCDNGIDDDADGLVDCFDDECIAHASCTDFFFGNTPALPSPTISPTYSLNLQWGSPDQSANSHATAAVGDIDQDGIPEVIVTNKQTQSVYVLNGEDGSIQWQVNVGFDPENAVAIGDINDDNCAEVFVSEDGGTGNIKAYDCTGAEIWAEVVGDKAGLLGLADFDGDGQVELYYGDEIRNAATGAVIIARTGNQEVDWTFGSLAVDILPDGACPSCAGLELITGNEIWAVDIPGTAKFLERDMDTPLAGPTYHPKFIDATAENKSCVSVADMNQDGFLDVIVPGALGIDHTGTTTIFFWDVQNDVVITYDDPTNNFIRGMGRISIADIDGDGQLNACYVSDQKFYALDETFNPLWIKNIQDGPSGFSGNTLFDFDDDGVLEVLYRSESELLIIDGFDGTTIQSVPCISRQQDSYPLVADVDADGASEICVTCYTSDATPYNPYANTQFSQIRIYEADGGETWMPSRSVWNQHGHFNVNVNDDLTIARQQQDHSVTIGLDCQTNTVPKQPLNTFMMQSTFLDADGCPAVSACAVMAGFITTSGGNNDLLLNSYEGGATLQWESSPDNVTWTPIPGETTDSYTAGPVGTPIYFRVAVTNGCTVTSPSFLVVPSPPPPFIGNFAFRQRVIIRADRVVGTNDLIDFPVLVKTVDEELKDFVQHPNGFDIAFADIDGNPLDHDLESFDAATGELVAWVRIPTLSHTIETEFFMYYGDGGVTIDPSLSSTWSNNFEGVWHLGDNLLDATINAYDGTDNGTVIAPGIIGSARDFEESEDDAIDLANFDIGTGVATLSAWINVESSTVNNPYIITKNNGPANNQHVWQLGLSGTPGNLRSQFRATAIDNETISVPVPTGSWQFVQAVFNGADIKHYVNGVDVGSEAQTGVLDQDAAVPVRIGNDAFDAGNGFDGLIDELRVIGAARSADWIATEYHNQNNPQDFLEFDFTESSAFITTWRTTAPSESITIPTNGGGYNYDVDWGDGMSDTGFTGDASHVYATPGDYEVVITGNFPRIFFNGGPDANKILSVDNWGEQPWASMANAFDGCTNLRITAYDAPDLSGVTSMENMFRSCMSLNDDIGFWDTFNVQNMQGLFEGAMNFNQPLGGWSTTNVINMSNMFMGSQFDQNIGSWDVSSLTVAAGMFDGGALSIANYDALLFGWSSQTVQANVNFSAGSSQYCDGAGGRTTLTTGPNNWIITDGGAGQCAFITRWTVGPGETITIPTFGGETYFYNVNWGDGADDTNVTGDVSHTYGGGGTYDVTITGLFPRIYFNNAGDLDKIVEVSQWGANPWTSMAHAFEGCLNIEVTAADEPNLLNVTDMSAMFRGCDQLVGSNLGTWNTENVTNMSSMFQSTGFFDGPIGGWVTSSVEDMSNMFNFAGNFNQPLENWQTWSVTNMSGMFQDAALFNQDIGNWSTDFVIDMSNMFNGAGSFNQDISQWYTHQVADMSHMFQWANAFNQDLSQWKTDNVTDMSFMFADAMSFNSDIGNWNTGKVANMSNMFNNAMNFDQDLGNWDVTMLTDADNMFNNSAFTSPNYDALLNGWGSQPVQSSVPLGVGTVQYCAGQVGKDALEAASWTITDGGNAGGCGFVTTWQTTLASETVTIPTFGAGYNYSVDWGDASPFDNGLTGDASHVYASPGTYTVTILGDFPRIYFNNGGDKDKIQSVEEWGGQIWTSMQGAFHGCSNLVINAPDVPDLTAVTDMSNMFMGCTALTNEDFSGWDVGTVTNMAQIFRDASSFNGNIDNWNTGSVTLFNSAFRSAAAFDRDISGWDVSMATSMINMFGAAITFNQNISIWDVSSVTNMSSLFNGAIAFDQNLGSWDMTSVLDATAMFAGATLNTANYDATLIGWAAQALQSSVAFDGGNSYYCEAATVLHTLQAGGREWAMSDAGPEPGCAFVMTWETTTANETVAIPTFGAGYSYNVDWGDGSPLETGFAANASHNYVNPLTYTVTITGDFPRIYFNDVTDTDPNADKIQSIEQWGLQQWESMGNAFSGCSNLVINASDQPDLSLATDLGAMFSGCTALNNEDFSAWDVSTITNFFSTFQNASSFNGNVTSWNTAAAVNMVRMFEGASAFDQNIGGWNTAAVTDMSFMFSGADVFNQNIGSWVVSSVNNMSSMFADAFTFNQNIGGWSTGALMNTDNMFENATLFDQDLGAWTVTALNTAADMFGGIALSTANYEALLTGWSGQALQSGVNFGAGGSTYCAASGAKATLTGTFIWTITDGGIENCTTTSTANGNWSDNASWDNGAPVGAGNSVTIGSGTNITLDVTQAIENLTVQAGATLDLAGHVLTVSGDLVVDGTINGTAGAVERLILDGTNKNISGSGFISSTFQMRILGPKTILAGSNLTFTGGAESLNIADGTIVTNQGTIEIHHSVKTGGGGTAWINDTNSTLEIATDFFENASLQGTWDCLAVPNTVRYIGPGNQGVRPADGSFYNLEFAGTGVKELLGNITVVNDLIITSTLDASAANNYNVTLAGDWQNNGTFNAQQGAVIMNGTAGQTIANPAGEVFYNLIVNAVGTTTLSNNANVTNELTMSMGDIIVSPGQKLTLGTSTVSEGTLSYTAGLIDGEFERWIGSTATDYLYPVGVVGAYRPATVRFNDLSTAGRAVARFDPTAPTTAGFPFIESPVYLTAAFTEGFWILATPDGLATSDFDLTLLGSGFVSQTLDNDSRIVTKSAGDWIADGMHGIRSGDQLSRTNLTLFNTEYTFASAGPCPPISVPVITGALDVCDAAGTITYSVPLNAGNTYTWGVTGGATITSTASGVDVNSIDIDWMGASPGDVSVTESNGCGSANNGMVSVEVHPQPIPAVSGITTVATGTTMETYSLTPLPGYTYNWASANVSGTAAATLSTATGPSVDADFTGEGVVRLTVSAISPAACASPAPLDYDVTVVNSFTSVQNGSFSDPATWDCNCVPPANGDIVIGHNVTLDANYTSGDMVINGAGVLDNGTQTLTVTGDYTVNGTHNGMGSISINGGGANFIDGVGTVTNLGGLSIEINTTVGAGADLTVSASILVAAGVTVVNQGTLSVGGDIIGSDGASTWNNDNGSNLTITGQLLLGTGVLIASGAGNMVHYNGGLPQDIKVPSAGDYDALQTSGAGAKNLIGDIQVAGNLTTDGGNFDLSSFTLTVNGPWANTTTLVPGTSSVILAHGSPDNVPAGLYHNLLIQGAVVKTLAGPIGVSGDLTIQSGSTLNASGANHSITIQGNWTNNGAWNAQMGSVTFDGTAAQSINSAGPQAFYDLIVNTTGGVSMTSLTTVNNALTMTNGNITVTGGARLVLGTSTANEGTLNYTDGIIFGEFERWIGTTATFFDFPIGGAGTYRPARINFANLTTQGSVMVNFNAVDPGLVGYPITDDVTLISQFTEGYWQVVGLNGIATTDFTLELTGNAFSSETISDNTRIVRRAVSNWEAAGTHLSRAGNTVSRSGLDVVTADYAFAADNNCQTIATSVITGNVTACAGGTDVYSVTATPGNTYDWSVTGGTIQEAGGASTYNAVDANSITVDWGTAGAQTVTVTETRVSCPGSDTETLNLTVHPLAISAIAGNISLPGDGAPGEAYSISAEVGYSYSWTIANLSGTANGTFVSAISTGPAISVDWTGEGTAELRVSAVSPGGCVSPADQTIVVNLLSTYATVQAGNFGDPATWDCGCVPFPNGNLNIGHNLTLDADYTSGDINLAGGSILDNGIHNLTVTGDYTVNGTHTGTGNILLQGDGSKVIAGSGTINGTAGLQILANMTLQSGAIQTLDAQLSIGTGVTLTNEGTLDLNGNAVGADATSTVLNGASGILSVSGDLLNTGALDASAVGNVVNYDGTTIQGVKVPVGGVYADLLLNGTAAQPLVGDITVNGDLNSNSANFALNNFTLTINGTWSNSGSINVNTSTIHYASSAAQNILPLAYNNLTISGAGAKTLAANLVVSGDLNILGTLDVSANNYQIDLAGNLTTSGTFIRQSGTVVLNGSAQSITGTVTFYDLTHQSLGTTTFLNDVVVENTLSMVSGQIDVTASNRLTLGTGLGVTGSLVFTAGGITGTLERWIDAPSVDYGFPLGTGGESAFMVNFANVSGGTLQASFIAGDPGTNGMPLTDVSYPLKDVFTEGVWEVAPGNGLATTDVALNLTGTNFTSFNLHAEARVVNRANGGSPWAVSGTHSDADIVTKTARRTLAAVPGGQFGIATYQDTQAPVVTVNSLVTADQTPDLSGTVDDLDASVDVLVDGTTYNATVNADNTWDVNIGNALAEQVYEVVVTATDSVSNVGNDATANELTVDISGPVVTFDALLTNDNTPALSGSINELTTILDVVINGVTYAAANDGSTWSIADNVVNTLADGSYNVEVFGTDLLGNNSNQTFIGELGIDATVPVIDYTDVVSNELSPALSGTVDDPSVSVIVTVNAVDYPATNNGDGTWSVAAGTLEGLTEGIFDVAVVATDSAGNSGTSAAASGLTIDQTTPVVSIDELSTFDQTPTLTGSIDDASASIVVQVGSQSLTATNNGDGTWVLPGENITALNVGIYDVVVTASDGAGNPATDATTDELRILPAAAVANPGQDITVSSFVASWSNPGGGAFNYLLDVSEDSSFRRPIEGFEELLVTGQSQAVSNLAYSSDYFYRVKVQYASGDISDWSDTIRVRTATDPATALDSLALVNIYNTTDGDNWVDNSNWLTGRVDEWYGILMEEARVVAVALDSNALAGEIDPISEGLDLVRSVDVSYNDISEVRDLSALSSLQELNVAGNRLQFGTLEALASLSATINFDDQQEVLEPVRRLFEAGNTFTIDRTLTGDNNTYAWFRNGDATGDTGPTLDLNIESPAQEGSYHVEVTNAGFPGLTLTSAPVIIRVSSLERDQAALLVLYDSAGGAQWTNGVNWTIQDDISLWDGVTLENNRVIAVELSNRNVTGFIPDDLTDIGGLRSIDFSDNNITRLPDLTSLSSLETLDVSNNALDFDDLEVNMSILNFTYADQAPFGPQNVEVKVPRSEDYELRIVVGGDANTYQWSFVGEEENGDIEGATGKKYRINDIRYENQGAYKLTVENPNVPGLVLTSYEQTILATVDLSFLPLYRDFDDLLALLTNGEATLMKIIAPNQPFDTLNIESLGTNGLDFTQVVTGDYLIGLRSDSLIIRGNNVGDTIQFLPTYFGDTFLWEEADTLLVRESIEGDSIIMQQRPRELTEADGDGEVTLTVESLLAELQNQGRGAKVQARRVVKRAGCSLRRRRRATGGRVENDEFELVAYKETDDQGRVTFNNLPAGTYRLTIEYPGIPMDPDSFIEFDVNEGGMEQESLTLEATVAEEGIAVELVEALGIYRRYFRNLSVYPNPATDYLHVAYDELKVKTVVMELYDMQGQRRLSKPLDRRYQGKEMLDLIDVPNGMYLLRMLDTERKKNIVTFRVLVRKP